MKFSIPSDFKFKGATENLLSANRANLGNVMSQVSFVVIFLRFTFKFQLTLKVVEIVNLQPY